MKSEEIKDLITFFLNDKNRDTSVLTEYYKVVFTGEIAFQLAKLNEHFEDVDHYIFRDERTKRSGKR